jgi:hypothetical protein
MRRSFVLPLLATLALGAASPAAASVIVDRNATDISLQVDGSGHALVTYTDAGQQHRVLAWGAMNALAPTRSRAQSKFRLDYSGGYSANYQQNPQVKRTLAHLQSLKTRSQRATASGDDQLRYQLGRSIAADYRTLSRLRAQASKFSGTCGPYDGPALPWLVVACKAPDGSYWALQSWQRMLPNLGEAPWQPQQSVWELHLSHWSGPLEELDIHLDWVNTQKARHVFGRLTYLGKPVYGFGSKSDGNPTDTYGRNIYLDVLNGAYGPGWHRENSFLAHNPGGDFCYGLYPHAPYPGYPAGDRPAGNGDAYRATVIGPGVLPDVSWQGDDIGEYDLVDSAKVGYEQQMNALEDQFAAGDKLCHQH